MQMYVFIDRKYAKLCTFEIVSMQNIDSTQLKIDERCQQLPGKNYPHYFHQPCGGFETF